MSQKSAQRKSGMAVIDKTPCITKTRDSIRKKLISKEIDIQTAIRSAQKLVQDHPGLNGCGHELVGSLKRLATYLPQTSDFELKKRMINRALRRHERILPVKEDLDRKVLYKEVTAFAFA